MRAPAAIVRDEGAPLVHEALFSLEEHGGRADAVVVEERRELVAAAERGLPRVERRALEVEREPVGRTVRERDRAAPTGSGAAERAKARLGREGDTPSKSNVYEALRLEEEQVSLPRRAWG